MSQRRSVSPQIKLTEDQKQKIQKTQKAAIKRSKTKTNFFNEHGYTIVIGIFVVVIVFAVASTLFSKKKDPKKTPVIDLEEIENINAENRAFKTGPNEFFQHWMLSEVKKTLNTQLSNKNNIPYCSTHDQSIFVNEQYNFRTEYPECAQHVWNQGNCSSSYAVAAVSAMADRYCQLHKQKIHFSPQQLLSCDKNFSLGCDGGYVTRTFDYAKRYGIVDTNCLSFNPVADKLNETHCDSAKECNREKILDYCVSTKEEGIKREIQQNGPVVSVLPMFRDFMIYKEGIYEVYDGTSKFNSGHAVKIIGWGSENGRDYWIIENSYGESWGEKGFARVATKQKELYIDEYAIGPVWAKPTAPEDVNQPTENNEKIIETQDL